MLPPASCLVTSHGRLSNPRRVAYGMLFALLFSQSKHSASSRWVPGEAGEKREPLAVEPGIHWLCEEACQAEYVWTSVVMSEPPRA